NFAEYYGLGPGDSVSLVVLGRETVLEIAGTFTSPEYIWKAISEQEPFVGRGEFAVVMARAALVSRLLGSGDLMNEIVVRFKPDTDPNDVTNRLTETLSPFGIQSVTQGEDQISYSLLKLDLDGFGELAVAVPIMFLIITAMVIYVLLVRTIQSQQPLIGLMRAVGFSRGQVLRHFLMISVVIAVAGDILGIALGLALGRYVTELYADTIGIPYVVIATRIEIAAIASMLGLIVCVIAGFVPARRAANMAPSEAMRPGTTGVGGTQMLERLIPMGLLPYTPRLALRNLVRRWGRSLSSALGVAMAVALVIASVGMLDSMGHAFTVQFDEIQRYDMKVSFTQPTWSDDVGTYYGSWAEVSQSEPIAELPITMTHQGVSQNTLLAGLAQGSGLMRFDDFQGAEPLTYEGLWLTEGLARSLDVEIGDSIELASELGTSRQQVMGTVSQPLSGAAYARLTDVQALFGASYATGALLRLKNPDSVAETTAALERLHATTGVLAVERPDESRRSFEELMSLFYQFVGIFVLFGVALGAVAIFNTVTINIIERNRELATMRALGFSKLGVDMLLTIENMLGGALGILLGLVLGYLLEVELLSMFQSEMFSLDVFIAPMTYLIVGVSSLLVALLSQAPGLRSLHRTNLALATKQRIS
ncbi:MAG: FtsX-like permease family protein, partial [SAR202 cluster bacterium]|nr:FtsX-like permease family protein [SAR202 cluster bacterium]